MVATVRGNGTRLTALAALLLVGASCTSEKTVYRDASGPTPPVAAVNFVGYARNDTKQTVCGNCHVDLQTKWVQTGHAKAFADLESSGHAASYCEDCHAVSGLGNGATGKVAFSATRDPRYQDVQCENCHGAGAVHAANPSSTNILLASIAVDTATGTKFTCAGCHTGTHEPFVDQWKVSAHNWVDSHAGSNASCQGCHTGQGALKVWNVNTNYVEKNSTTTQPITCAVCHDPHSKDIDKQLRFSITATDTSKNLCMKCHNRSAVPQWTSSRYGTATHAPESATLLGYAGWFPAGYMTDPTQGGAIIGTHGSTSNPQTCATCHVARFAVNDAKNTLIFQATGHTFSATPCLDSLGRPLSGTSCAPTQMSFKSCTGSGCHGSEAAARGALTTAQTRIGTLVEELESMLAKVPASEKTVLKYTPARGAMFNVSLAAGGDGEEVMTRLGGNIYAGQAAHNPFLIEQLLTNSIKAVQSTYGVSPSATLVLTPILQRH